ncbi:hypothetical protein B0H12DRAFT_1127619 [Mycena haematopus]|nr:hypothetical protein B0H12DRAFT_1127619 [Mycena haematopus]
MSLFTNIPVFALFLAITPQVHAFTNFNNGRHTSTTGRIVGIVVAVVVLLVILACACAVRRRRMRAVSGPIIGGGSYAPGAGSGKFGGFGGGFGRPWGTGAAQNQNQNTQWQQNQNQASYFPGGQPAGAKYGEPNPPPYTGEPQRAYAPPPGAPPQAHVNGQQSGFVGGFRS